MVLTISDNECTALKPTFQWIGLVSQRQDSHWSLPSHLQEIGSMISFSRVSGLENCKRNALAFLSWAWSDKMPFANNRLANGIVGFAKGRYPGAPTARSPDVEHFLFVEKLCGDVCEIAAVVWGSWAMFEDPAISSIWTCVQCIASVGAILSALAHTFLSGQKSVFQFLGWESCCQDHFLVRPSLRFEAQRFCPK